MILMSERHIGPLVFYLLNGTYYNVLQHDLRYMYITISKDRDIIFSFCFEFPFSDICLLTSIQEYILATPLLMIGGVKYQTSRAFAKTDTL